MISTSLRALVLAGALLPAIGSVAVRAEIRPGFEPVRYVCNDDGRCFETGDLDRRDDDDAPPHRYRRPPPPPPDYDRDDRDFDRRPPPRDFDRRPPPPRDYDHRGSRDDDPD